MDKHSAGSGASVGLVWIMPVPDDRYANGGSRVSNQEAGFCAGVTTHDLGMSAIGKPDGGVQVMYHTISTPCDHLLKQNWAIKSL